MGKSKKAHEKQKTCMGEESDMWSGSRTLGWRGPKIIWSQIVFHLKMFEHHFKSKQAQYFLVRSWMGYTPFPSTNMPGTQQPPCMYLTGSTQYWVLSGCHGLLSHTVLCWEQDSDGQGQDYIRHCLPQLSLKNWYCDFQTFGLSLQWHLHINRHK